MRLVVSTFFLLHNKHVNMPSVVGRGRRRPLHNECAFYFYGVKWMEERQQNSKIQRVIPRKSFRTEAPGVRAGLKARYLRPVARVPLIPWHLRLRPPTPSHGRHLRPSPRNHSRQGSMPHSNSTPQTHPPKAPHCPLSDYPLRLLLPVAASKAHWIL